MLRIRLIPATIITAALLLTVKVIDISRSNELLSLEAMAQSAATSTATAEKKPETAGAKSAEAKPENGGDAKPVAEGKSEGGDAKDKDKKNPALADSAGDIVDHRFTPIELDMLQNLVKRREELDEWEKNIEVKEMALSATEKRVDDKIAQIDAMKQEVSGLLAEYNEKEDAKTQSLVKIYQAMKPKDAARIFDELDAPILLLVVDKMPEKNTAPILALMDPKKAKDVTVQLAEERKIGIPKPEIAK